MKIFRKVFLLVICTSFFFVKWGYADERILSFHSDIEISADTKMLVTETIKVRSEGKEIKRGIYRDYPLTYRDIFKDHEKVSFKVIDVLRNGQKISYRSKTIGRYIRVYMGSFSTTIPDGEYTFQLIYKTDNHIRFANNYDQVIYNITGNEWSFPIDNASADITIPDRINLSYVDAYAYTGPYGSTEKNVKVGFSENHIIHVETTDPLGIREGLTINIYFPKSSFTKEKREESLPYQFKQQVSMAGLGFLFCYYLIVWFFFGKDPLKGKVKTRTEVPGDMSPGLMRYILKMDFDYKILTAALVNMAYKGYLNIHETKGVYVIVKNKKADKKLLSADEKIIAQDLVSNQRLMLTGINYKKINKTVNELKSFLKRQAENIYFRKNILYFYLGMMLSVFYLFVCGYLNFLQQAGLFLIYLTITIFLNGLFFYLLRKPTRPGRLLLDQIEGFKEYLLKTKKFPEDPAPNIFRKHYEKYLSYAIVLDIEKDWDKLFEEITRHDAVETTNPLIEYSPDWYSGGSWFTRRGLLGFSHHMGHSYPVTPPPGMGGGRGYGGGSGGGGGFSGGGSGGGGGGGF